MIKDLVKYILKNIMQELTRSVLTILSIAIGIMAIFALISFGQGVTKYTDSMFNEIGGDKLIAMPKGFSSPGTINIHFYDSDLEAIKKTNGVINYAPMIMRQAEVKSNKKEKGRWVFIAGGYASGKRGKLMDEMLAVGIEKGKHLKDSDKNKVVLGHNYQLPDKIFEKPLKLGDKIYINSIRYEVVGFFGEIGNPSDDSTIFMNLDEIKSLLGTGNTYDMVYIQVDKSFDLKKTADKIAERLRKNRKQKKGEEDFYIKSFEEILDTYSSVLSILNAILVIISLISVIVAAVNITNTMYTSVLDRTKEIGIMKAIGAKNSHILFMFFVESGILGIIGGAIGLALGYIIAKAGGTIAAYYGYSMLRPYFSPLLAALLLVFSFAIGAFSGFFPARQASKLKPADTLRYE